MKIQNYNEYFKGKKRAERGEFKLEIADTVEDYNSFIRGVNEVKKSEDVRSKKIIGGFFDNVVDHE